MRKTSVDVSPPRVVRCASPTVRRLQRKRVSGKNLRTAHLKARVNARLVCWLQLYFEAEMECSPERLERLRQARLDFYCAVAAYDDRA